MLKFNSTCFFWTWAFLIIKFEFLRMLFFFYVKIWPPFFPTHLILAEPDHRGSDHEWNKLNSTKYTCYRLSWQFVFEKIINVFLYLFLCKILTKPFPLLLILNKPYPQRSWFEKTLSLSYLRMLPRKLQLFWFWKTTN